MFSLICDIDEQALTRLSSILSEISFCSVKLQLSIIEKLRDKYALLIQSREDWL